MITKVYTYKFINNLFSKLSKMPTQDLERFLNADDRKTKKEIDYLLRTLHIELKGAYNYRPTIERLNNQIKKSGDTLKKVAHKIMFINIRRVIGSIKELSQIDNTLTNTGFGLGVIKFIYTKEVLKDRFTINNTKASARAFNEVLKNGQISFYNKEHYKSRFRNAYAKVKDLAKRQIDHYFDPEKYTKVACQKKKSAKRVISNKLVFLFINDFLYAKREGLTFPYVTNNAISIENEMRLTEKPKNILLTKKEVATIKEALLQHIDESINNALFIENMGRLHDIGIKNSYLKRHYLQALSLMIRQNPSNVAQAKTAFYVHTLTLKDKNKTTYQPTCYLYAADFFMKKAKDDLDEVFKVINTIN